jgi:hypothetical protein
MSPPAQQRAEPYHGGPLTPIPFSLHGYGLEAPGCAAERGADARGAPSLPDRGEHMRRPLAGGQCVIGILVPYISLLSNAALSV